MNDYWLRGDDEAAVLAAMAEAGISTGPTMGSSFDPIGTIYDADGNPIPGWHANLRLRHELTFDQEAVLSTVLIEQPKNPVRVWG